MTYIHGVTTTEIPTALIPPVTSTAGLPVVFGTAPVNLVDGVAPVNKPILAYRYDEAVTQLGYSDDFDKYTLCEFMSSHFSLFGVAPVVFVNVLDPTKHKKSETVTATAVAGEIVLEADGILKQSVVVQKASATVDAVELEFDDEGKLHIFTTETVALTINFDVIDPTAVTADDIVGGVSMDGTYKGLELVNHVFPSFRLVPGVIVAPKFSTSPLVAAVMGAKAATINGLFKAIALVDVPTDEVRSYTDVAKYKNDNNLTSTHQVPCWPKASLGGKQYHLSTQAAGVIALLDSQNEGMPYKSPSNKNLQADSAVLADGTEVLLGQDQAAYLNGQGIVTMLNFIGGWKLWGNRTACYPGNSDPEDSFIAVRRMFNFEQNNLILTYWQKVDDSMNKKLIELVRDSINIDLNAKANRGFILGGRLEFYESENPLTNLIDGIVKFHLYLTPPTPAREIGFLVEFDQTYFNTLFN